MSALIAKFWQAGKVVSAVCHGPVALAGVQVDGKPLVAGKKVTGPFAFALVIPQASNNGIMIPT